MRRASLRCLVDGAPSPLGPRGEAWLVPGSLRALRDCYLPQWAGTSADFEGAGDLEDPVGCRIRPPAGWSFTATVTVLDPGPGLPAAAFVELIDAEGFGATLASFTVGPAAFEGLWVGATVVVSGIPNYMAMRPTAPHCELELGPSTRLAVLGTRPPGGRAG